MNTLQKTIRASKRTFASMALLFVLLGVPAALAQESFRPTLSVPIPNVQFSTMRVQETNEDAGISGFMDIPWIAQYIQGVYVYGVSIAGVIAGVTIVIGGFQYMTGKVAEGKEKIKRSLIAVTLMFSSFLILKTINPDLTYLISLRIKTVKREEFITEPGGIDQGVSDPGAAVAGGETTMYDDLFKKYSPCAGLDWRILKAVAKKESAFNATVVNKWGFIGLFQTNVKFCSLKAHGRGDECTVEGLKNPDANAASVSGGQLRSGANIIRTTCPQVKDVKRFVMLLYYGHNSGPGALKSVLKNVGCNATEEQYFKASSDFWAGKVKDGKPIPNQDGRMQYAVRVANSAIGYGATDPFATTGTCPF